MIGYSLQSVIAPHSVSSGANSLAQCSIICKANSLFALSKSAPVIVVLNGEKVAIYRPYPY